MIYSDVKNAYGYSAKDVYEYRERTGASMSEAHAHFKLIHRVELKAEMRKRIESGTLEDIQHVVKILVEHF